MVSLNSRSTVVTGNTGARRLETKGPLLMGYRYRDPNLVDTEEFTPDMDFEAGKEALLELLGNYLAAVGTEGEHILPLRTDEPLELLTRNDSVWWMLVAYMTETVPGIKIEWKLPQAEVQRPES